MMSASHHPGDELLVDYASGSIREPLALLVATHLALCPSCRTRVKELEELGGALVDALEPDRLRDNAFEQTMARAERTTAPERERNLGVKSVRPKEGLVPRPLRDYLDASSLDELNWKRRTGNLSELRLLTSFSGYDTRLMRIKAGASIPTHTHDGSEYTLVLAGGFSDQHGHFVRGDVAVADQGITHRPVADQDEDCICLAVTDAPLRFTGAVGKLINLIGKFH